MSLIIRQVSLNGKTVDVHIKRNKIYEISNCIKETANQEISGKNRALLPALLNGHTHSAMTLLRGYCDDMPLFPWLQEKIWPAEALYEKEDFIWGYRLAFLEMIRGGTCFFNDMYFQPSLALDLMEESGLKGAINYVFLNPHDLSREKEQLKECELWFNQIKDRDSARFSGLAPHAIYTVSESTLRWIGDFAKERGLIIHTHLSETEQENKDCLKAHGKTPLAWLDHLGLTGPHLSIAHGLWLTESDFSILSDYSIPVVNNPASNMKLSSGPALNFRKLRDKKIPVILGTDGCSSNNNLDMLEEMKLAALLQKQHSGDPTLMTAEDVFDMGTLTPATFWNTRGGIIEQGAEADLMLVKLNHPDMVPCHNLISNLVYSSNSSAVDGLIVGGRVLMEKGIVPGEEEILEQSAKRGLGLAKRAAL